MKTENSQWDNLTPEVEAISKIHFEGNIIPHRWYQTITYTTPTGQTKPHLEAILILSDVVYWYRPAEVRDENTGKLLGYRKKFRADLLQRHYNSLAEQFGITKKRVQLAIYFLREKGLLEVEMRTITTAGGAILNNVPFLKPIPERIYEVTYGMDTPLPQISERGISNEEEVSPIKGRRSTETSTENTSLSPERETHVLPPEVRAWYTAHGLTKYLDADPGLLLAAYRSCRADEGKPDYPGPAVRVKAILKGTWHSPQKEEPEPEPPRRHLAFCSTCQVGYYPGEGSEHEQH